MRIDKYLKLSRLIKRRTIAKEVLAQGFVTINGRVAKPASEVNIGDIIFLKLGRHHLEVKVMEIEEITTRNSAANLYEIISDTIVKEEE